MNKEKVVREINDYIDSQKKNILSTLKKYISFRSINKEQLFEGETSEIVECQKWVANELGKTGFFDEVDYYEIEKGRPNVVGIKKGEENGRSLLFNCHSDVVRVTEEQEKNWDVLSPFDGGVEDGKVWGRGASDMKSGGVAMIFAAKALKALNLDLKGDLLLSFVDGEESGRADIGIYTLIDKGYIADFAIVCEPTNLENIFNKSRGEIVLTIKIKGESTHPCNRYKTIWPQKRIEDRVGVNAIDKMVKLINAFNELERSWGLEYFDSSMDPGSTTLSISYIKGGENFCSQAGECEMAVVAMFVSQLSVKDIKQQIISTIDYISDHDYWLKNHRPEYNIPFLPKEPLNISENDEAIKTMISSYKQVTGKSPFIKPSPFVGDANYMFEKGIKCINWGPGDITLAHSTNEHVNINQVVDAAKIYAMTIINWCGIEV